MPSLEERLATIREGAVKRIAAEHREKMHRATEALQASGAVDLALGEGDDAPRFELPDSRQSMVSLDGLLAEGPVVLTFFRGQWWPYCNAELDALNKTTSEITEMGGRLIAISPVKPELSRELIERHRLGFEILRDEGNDEAERYRLRYALPGYLIETYKSFGIDLESSNGDASWTLPLPARYVIDTAGVIRYARVNADYRFRPEPAETVEALRSVVNG